MLARFRYSDLKEGVCDCGGRVRYGNSIVGRSGAEVCKDRAAKREHMTPCTDNLATAKSSSKSGLKKVKEEIRSAAGRRRWERAEARKGFEFE